MGNFFSNTLQLSLFKDCNPTIVITLLQVVFIDALHSKEKEEQSSKFDDEMNKLKDFILNNQPYTTTISNYGPYKIMYNMMNNYIEARDSQDQNMKAETNFCGYSSCSKWRWQYFWCLCFLIP